MATMGRITVPEIAASGAFPFRTDYPAGTALGRTVIVHGFADGVEQRFYVGSPATRYAFIRRTLTLAQRASLASFWRGQQGAIGAFSYDVPQEDGSFVTKTVRFENADLKLEDLANAICSSGLTFVEIPDPTTAPVYSIAATVTRFPIPPGGGVATGCPGDHPLVRIRVLEAAVADIYLSDRLVTVGGQVYLPRLLRVGQQGGDVLVEQKIDGSSDDVQFTFGNADRVMISLANDTELMGARVELSLFHVASLRKLDLWAGDVVDWARTRGRSFTVKCSDT